MHYNPFAGFLLLLTKLLSPFTFDKFCQTAYCVKQLHDVGIDERLS